MNSELLMQLGLNKTQAKAYVTLVKHGSLTPPKLSKITGETRTNAYSVLDKLVDLGLAKKSEHNKKFVYRVENPVALEKLVMKHRNEALAREKKVKDAMPALLNYFYTYSEQPGVRFFQGKDGIEAMYNDQLRTNQPLTMVRTRADLPFFGSFEAISSVRHKFNTSPIERHMLTPDAPETKANWEENDTQHGNTRTWLREDDYTAPVEWAVYDSKVAIISFGEEAMGMIIESPQIAEAFRQILQLADKGSRLQPDYDKLPRLASKTKRY